MNTQRLSNLATALRDAQQKEAFVETFTFEVWGFSREEDARYGELDEAWPLYEQDEDGFIVHENDVDHDEKNEFINDAVMLIPHNCGAPACALGHYALRTDLQDRFRLADNGQVVFVDRELTLGGVADGRIAEHFDITIKEAAKFFGSNGCGGAETPGEAADFIESFIKNRS